MGKYFQLWNQTWYEISVQWSEIRVNYTVFPAQIGRSPNPPPGQVQRRNNLDFSLELKLSSNFQIFLTVETHKLSIICKKIFRLNH